MRLAGDYLIIGNGTHLWKALNMDAPAGSHRLYRGEKVGLVLFGVLLVTFGVLTEIRSCFLSSRKTDFGVYLRAAWAVRTNSPMYEAWDNNGWHYAYPPAFAIVMTPFADPTAGEPRPYVLAYSVSVAFWTLFNYVLISLIVNNLANTLLPDAKRGSRRWWYARMIPVYVCLGGLSYTIGRGQVNILLTGFLVGIFVASVNGRFLRSGMWLAAAITLKVIPAYLLIYPFVRKEYRVFAGVALGLVLGFVIIPITGLGVEGAIRETQNFADRVLTPGATGTGNQAMAKELTNVSATDSQSFMAAIHNNIYPDRESQPTVASSETRLAHMAIFGLLTLITVIAAYRKGTDAPADRLIFLGTLAILMLHGTPVSHMHYYALGLPLVAGLWLKGLQRHPGAISAGPMVLAPLLVWAATVSLPLFGGPVTEMLRHRGLGLAGSMLLWAVGIRELGRTVVVPEVVSANQQSASLSLAA